MSDPLDPMDALVGGVTDSVKRLLAFVVVTAGAAILGYNVHEIPTHLSALRTGGFSSVLAALQQFDASAPIAWMVMMLHSLIIWYLFPMVLLYFALLVWLWKGEDMFNILLGLALLQPLHTFLYMQRSSPLVAGDLALAIGALVIAEVSLAALILWWRNVSENAPLPPSEAEPEL
ncbi:MAG TPA: hypothetical protein VFG14_15740 [Chthoniobacteraceae bacterium]|nr:hypothetical protein [Chthoniobacteraceae bacterium]